jgi:hypothetical protein
MKSAQYSSLAGLLDESLSGKQLAYTILRNILHYCMNILEVFSKILKRGNLVLLFKAVFRIRKIFIRTWILGPISIITDPDPDPTCSPAIVNEHYWSMHHISKLKVPTQKFPFPVMYYFLRILGIKEIRLHHIILINNVAKKSKDPDPESSKLTGPSGSGSGSGTLV